MSEKQFTHLDVLAWLGESPAIPTPDAEDKDSRDAPLDQVSYDFGRRVGLNTLVERYDTPDALPSFQAELSEFVANAEGLECREFSSRQSEWSRLAGTSGYALVDPESGRAVRLLVIWQS